MKQYAIEVTNLTKKSGTSTRVDKLNLRVPEKCVYGFLGPNGAGKSTTLKMILGLIHATNGTISILGNTITLKNRMQLLSHVGSLIESPSFYGHLTGQENLEIIANYKKVNKNEIPPILSMIGLSEHKNKKVKHYSLGMKQRLGIGMALLGNPEILILDEPTNGLDPAGIHEIREFIKSLPMKMNMTVIVSSHLLNEIEQMADYVGIIDQGKLLYDGPLKELQQQGKSLEEIFITMTKEG